MTRNAAAPTRLLLTRGLVPGLLLGLAAAFFLPGAAASQTLTWNDISGPPGFSSMYELGDGTLYAITDDVLYRSFDAGVTWENIRRPGGPILEFAARGVTTAIAVNVNAPMYKQYFVSTDRGDTWTRASYEGSPSGSPVHVSLMIHPDGTLCALYPAGPKMAVERLTGGAWQRLGVPSGVYNITDGPPAWTVSAIDAEGNIYIGTTTDGIHSTRDGGQSWTRTLSYRYVSAIDFSPAGRAAIATRPNGETVGGVFTSADRGATWAPSGLTDLYMSGLRFNGAGEILVLGTRISGSATGIYRLGTGSAEWDSTEAFDFDYGTFHVAGGVKYIATSPGLGVNASTDDGATWRPDGVRKQDLFSVTTAQDGSILAGTIGKGLFRTIDGGERWERILTPGTPEYFYTLVHRDSVILGGTETGLYASADNGLSWLQMSRGINPAGGDLAVYAVAVDAGGGIFIGTGAGVFLSRDRGATWRSSGLGNSTVNGFALSLDGAIYAATGADGVFASTDGGQSWLSKGLVRPDIQTIAVAGGGEVFVGVASGIFFSTDAGRSWTRRIFTRGHVHSLLFNGNFHLYAGSSDGLFESNDAGQSWATAGLESQFVIDLSYNADRTISAAIYKGGVVRTSEVITSVDGGPAIPVSPSLSQNYPNPFNPLTTIAYEVPEMSRVTLRVFDILGRVSETLVDGVVPPGSHSVGWDGKGRPSGVYFYRVVITPEGPAGAGGDRRSFTEIRKMLLLK